MRFSWLYLGLALAMPLGACSSSADQASSGSPALPGDGTVVAFGVGDSIGLEPGESKTITVTATPPGAYEITFALVGQTFDASLDQSSARADSAGSASVTLHAPNQPTTFRLRATVDGGGSAELAVAVSAKGFGTIRVVPRYAGKRAVSKWSASVVARTTCADLASVLPTDPTGALTATSNASGDPLVKNAPVGPNLAVAVRAGHFAWGCADVANLKAGAELPVDVDVTDRPIDLASTDLALDLEYAPEGAEYAALVAETLALMTTAFAPKGESEGAALLDAMATHAPDVADFTAARSAGQWDALADTALAKAPIEGLLGTWVTDAVATESKHLVGHVYGGKSDGTGKLSIISLGSVAALDAGITSDALIALGSAAGDTVIASGTIHWLPSNYVAALALARARNDVATATTMADALATSVDCASLAKSLTGDASCDTQCLASACHDALGDMWATASQTSATAGLFGAINFNATATATVDDAAAPTALDGTWLGSVTDTIATAKTKGKLVAKKQPVAPK